MPMIAIKNHIPENAPKYLNCGGTLISNRYLITAQHCISGASGTYRYFPFTVDQIDIMLPELRHYSANNNSISNTCFGYDFKNKTMLGAMYKGVEENNSMKCLQEGLSVNFFNHEKVVNYSITPHRAISDVLKFGGRIYFPPNGPPDKNMQQLYDIAVVDLGANNTFTQSNYAVINNLEIYNSTLENPIIGDFYGFSYNPQKGLTGSLSFKPETLISQSDNIFNAAKVIGFSGDSGSPVFFMGTEELIGILVKSDQTARSEVLLFDANLTEWINNIITNKEPNGITCYVGIECRPSKISNTE